MHARTYLLKRHSPTANRTGVVTRGSIVTGISPLTSAAQYHAAGIWADLFDKYYQQCAVAASYGSRISTIAQNSLFLTSSCAFAVPRMKFTAFHTAASHTIAFHCTPYAHAAA